MRTVLFFLFVLLLSTGIMLGALSMKNATVPGLVVVGLWVLFIWHLESRSRKRARQKQREQMLDEWLYQQTRNKGHFH